MPLAALPGRWRATPRISPASRSTTRLPNFHFRNASPADFPNTGLPLTTSTRSTVPSSKTKAFMSHRPQFQLSGQFRVCRQRPDNRRLHRFGVGQVLVGLRHPKLCEREQCNCGQYARAFVYRRFDFHFFFSLVPGPAEYVQPRSPGHFRGAWHAGRRCVGLYATDSHIGPICWASLVKTYSCRTLRPNIATCRRFVFPPAAGEPVRT